MKVLQSVVLHLLIIIECVFKVFKANYYSNILNSNLFDEKSFDRILIKVLDSLDRRDAGAQMCHCNATVVDSIPTWE